MRRLFAVVLLMVILASPPSIHSTSTKTTEPSFTVAQDSQQLPRVYGVNLAYEIYSESSRTSYQDFVETLTEFGSRFTRNTENNLAARDWVQEQLTSVSNGRIEVDLVGSLDNIVGRLPGYLPGDHPVFAVTAHYDSADGSPGANDNGSGVALVLELARIMSQYEWPLDIYFCAFNAAVPPMFGQPLQGSEQVAQAWSDAGIDLLALYNVDTILYSNRFAALDERILIGYADITPYQTSHYWADLAKMIGNIYAFDLIRPMSSDTFPIWSDSDHWRFYRKGFQQVVCAYESGYMYDDLAGTESDVTTQARYNFYLGKELAGIIGASMAFTMGRSYGDNIRLYPDGTVYGESSHIFHFALTASTVLNATFRWWGAGADFNLYSPTWTLIDSALFPEPSAWEFTQVFNTPISQPGLYHLVLNNPNLTTLGFESFIQYDEDVDANGVIDRNEYWLDEALFNTDSDSDSLNDAMEIILGTDLEGPDTDLDTLPDGWEYEHSFDPLYSDDGSGDADNDGLTNYQEFINGLNPRSSDSDMDLIPDLFEVENGLDPLVDDAELDLDGDGLSNIEEYNGGTNPQVANETSLNLEIVFFPSVVIILVGAGAYVYRKHSSLL